MSKPLALVFALLALVPLCGCRATASASAPSDASLRASIEAATETMVRAGKANDMDAVASCYADDAVMLGPDAMRLAGRAEIDGFWTSLAGSIVDWQLDTFEVHGARDIAHQTGRSRLSVRDTHGATQLMEVLYSVIWRKQSNGEWKIVVDAFWLPVSKT